MACMAAGARFFWGATENMSGEGSAEEKQRRRALLESTTPVLIERVDHYAPSGGHVLYLDGHVEFHRYPGEWPMTETAVAALQAMDSRSTRGPELKFGPDASDRVDFCIGYR